MQEYTVNPSTHGINGFGLPAPDYVRAVILAASTNTAMTVPGDLPMGRMGSIGSINPIGNIGAAPVGRKKYIAKFSYGRVSSAAGDVWVAINATAAAPSTGSFAANTGELMPTAYDVYEGDTINAITATANTVMCVALYHITE